MVRFIYIFMNIKSSSAQDYSQDKLKVLYEQGFMLPLRGLNC